MLLSRALLPEYTMTSRLQMGFICFHRYFDEHDILSRKGETNKHREKTKEEKNKIGREKRQTAKQRKGTRLRARKWGVNKE
jgi:hypothetical protein